MWCVILMRFCFEGMMGDLPACFESPTHAALQVFHKFYWQQRTKTSYPLLSERGLSLFNSLCLSFSRRSHFATAAVCRVCNIHQSAVACLMSTNTVLMAMSYGILWPEQSIHKMLSPQEFMGHNEKVKYKHINLSSNTHFSAKWHLQRKRWTDRLVEDKNTCNKLIKL